MVVDQSCSGSMASLAPERVLREWCGTRVESAAQAIRSREPVITSVSNTARVRRGQYFLREGK